MMQAFNGSPSTLFQDLTFNGFGYAFASPLISILLSSETDFILFKNTSSTKLIRLYEQIGSIPDAAATLRSIVRIYKNPTVTNNGTAVAIGGLRNGQAATIAQAFHTPTISARGILVQIYGLTNTPTQRNMDLTRYVEPGDSLLVTAQPNTVTVNHSFTQAWAEVNG